MEEKGTSYKIVIHEIDSLFIEAWSHGAWHLASRLWSVDVDWICRVSIKHS